MTWKPEEKAWLAYLRFEERMGEQVKQREVLHRYMEAFPRLRTYLKVARFEIKNKNKEAAR
jgi:crooked neck